MAFQQWMVLFLFTLLTFVNAASVHQQQQSAVVSAAHTLKAHGRKARTEASLRGLGNSAAVAEDNGNDEEDDDDDEDDQAEAMSTAAKAEGKTKAKPVVMTLNSKPVSDNTVADSTAFYNDKKESKASAADEEQKEEKLKEEKEEEDEEAAEEEAARKKLEAAEKAVQAAKKKQFKAQRTANSFKDNEAFDAKIATETKLMTNETQSPALASFLGELRTEVRQYAMPAYPAYLQAELDSANKKVKMLEAEVKSNKEEDVKGVVIAKQAENKTGAKAEGKKEKATEVKAVSGRALAEQKAGEAFALSFFATVAMLAIVFAMASTGDDTVRNYTWFLMDQVVAIFIAVMYFNAFDSLLDFHSPSHKVFFAIAHALVMLTLVLGLAATFRKRKVALAILCGAGAHIVAFTSIHAAAGSQNKFVGISYTMSMCAFGICTLVFALAAIGYISYTAKRRLSLSEDDDYLEKTDDVENDFASMATSVAFTMFIRFAITGHHPTDDDTEFDHTQGQRNAMLLYAFVALGVAGAVTHFCSKKAAEPNASYGLKRAMAFCTTVCTMNVAWAVLYWGEWEFFEALYPDEAIKGRLMFAITMSILGGLALIALSKISRGDETQAVKSEKRVALVAVSLVIAWSWELCFDSAVEAMCEGVSHPAGWKIATTLMLGAIVIPVYGMYMKPISTKAAEAIGA